MSAPLTGENLVRLLYLDETGIAADAKSLTVAGVLVHGDRQWPKIDAAILALIDKYISPSQRLGFVFHAADIFHGTRYWKTVDDPAVRFSALTDLAKIIDDLALPVIVGGYEKDEFVLRAAEHAHHELKATILHNEFVRRVAERDELKETIIRSAAAIRCLVRADRWMERFAPRELATVVHEDFPSPSKKGLIQHCIEILRSEERMEAEGLNKQARDELRVPLRRIINTVYFATKSGARPLQLADLCAFAFGRFGQGKSVPNEAFDLIWKHARWQMPPERELIRVLQEEAIASGELPPETREILDRSRGRRGLGRRRHEALDR